MKINVTDLIGSQDCISPEDGQKVFKKAERLFKEGKLVILSFEQVDIISLVFLHEAIGKLYGFFDENIIKKNLTVKGLSPDDMELLKEVVDNAKRYFNNMT